MPVIDRATAETALREMAAAYLPGAVAELREQAAAVEDPWARASALAGVTVLAALGDVTTGLLAHFAARALDRLADAWPVDVQAGSVAWEDHR